MEKRKLGAGGPDVSAIGIGAMSFGDMYGPTTEENSYAVLDAAVELSIDHIDTSNVYAMGRSERAIGTWLKSRGENPFTIATKAAIKRAPDGTNGGFDNSLDHLESELDGSLARMGLERVDLFYIHRRDQSIPIEEVTGSLVRLIEKGKIASFGYSEIAPASLMRAASVHPVAAVQSEYSPATRSPELGLLQRTKSLDTAFVAFSPVCRGLLTDVPTDAARVAQSAFLQRAPRFQEPNLTANRAYAEAFARLAAEMGSTAAGLCIAWLLKKGPHVIPIPGTRSVAHLRELAAGATLTLSDADMARIEEVLPVGWAHGDRYSEAQWRGPESYS